MQLKTISKFVLGAICGTLVTLSIYATADNSSVATTSAVNAGIPVNEVNNFAKVYAITKNYYVESVTDTKLMNGAINGMLSNLDPHSSYLDADSFKQLSEMTAGEFAGLGIEVSKNKDDSIKVVAPIDGTPAYYAGIKSGDSIIKVDGVPVNTLTLDQAVKRMRGKPNTKVTLTIARKNELKPLTFTITRAIINVKSIKYTWIKPNYAYVRITNFQSNTTADLVSALTKLNKENPHIAGLVLDLRDDPGGLLQSAVGVAGTFLPNNDLVVYTDGRFASSKQKFYVKPDDYRTEDDSSNVLAKLPAQFKTVPMVVLVNQGTASASEIVAGALQDYKRAKIMGTRSFGKGSVQTVIPLSQDTAVKLTTALYYTPKGRSIQAKGIAPDIIVQSEYSDLYDSWDVSEAGLENHLDNPNAKTESITKTQAPVIMPPKQIKTQAELNDKLKQQVNQRPKVVSPSIAQIDLKTDFQLQWALNVLEGKPLPATPAKINK